MSLKFNIIQGKTSLRRSLGSVLYQILPSKIKNKPVIIGLHFVNEDEIKNLNNQYRFQNSSTDVLSFPLDLDLQKNHSEIDFGDIFICKNIAQKQSHSIHYLIVHGFLHLLGLKHESQKEYAWWERKEEKLIKLII